MSLHEFDPGLDIVEGIIEENFIEAKEVLAEHFIPEHAVEFRRLLRMQESARPGTIVPTITYDGKLRSLVMERDTSAMIESARNVGDYGVPVDEALGVLVGTGVARALLGWYNVQSREIRLGQEQKAQLHSMFYEVDAFRGQTELFDILHGTDVSSAIDRVGDLRLSQINALRAASGICLSHIVNSEDLPARWPEAMQNLLWEDETGRVVDLDLCMANFEPEDAFRVFDENLNIPVLAMAFPMSPAEISGIPVFNNRGPALD